MRAPCSGPMSYVATPKPTLSAQVAVTALRTRSNAAMRLTRALTPHCNPRRLRQSATQCRHLQGVLVTMGRMEPVTRPASRDTTQAQTDVITRVTPTVIGGRAASHALRRSATGTRIAIQQGPRSRMVTHTSIVARPLKIITASLAPNVVPSVRTATNKRQQQAQPSTSAKT
jgi:hypothetical protein